MYNKFPIQEKPMALLYDKYNILFKKNNVFIQKYVEVAVLDSIFFQAFENHLHSIKRYVYLKGVLIKWSLDADLYLVVALLNYYLNPEDEEDCYIIKINDKEYTEVNEDMLQNIINNNVKEINIYYKGDTEATNTIYDFESHQIYFVIHTNSSAQTTRLANEEFVRLNKLEFINTIQ